jgi:hypothetical protein
MTLASVSAHPNALLEKIVAAVSRYRGNDHHVLGLVFASDLPVRPSGDRGEPPRGHRLTSSPEHRHKSA